MEKITFSHKKGWKERILDLSKRRIYNFLNSHDLYQFNKEDLYRKSLLGHENVNYVDGFMISLYFSLKKLRKVQRLAGPILTKDFFKNYKSKNLRHLFIGFEKEDLKKFLEKYPNINRKKIFSYNPPYVKGIKFPKEEIEKMSDLINSKK